MSIAVRAAARRQTPAVAQDFQLSDKTLEAGSPQWWFARLLRKLDARSPEMRRFENYYNGQQPLVFATQKFRESFGDLFASFADNFAALVADAVDERLDVEGFRIPTGVDEADAGEPAGPADLDDDEADEPAWRIWQANHLDAESQLAHLDALVKGCAYIHVSPYRSDWIDDQTPLVTIEDALQCYVEVQPGGQRLRRAGVRRWVDDSGYLYANLYLPDNLYKFRTTTKVVDGMGRSSSDLSHEMWEPRTDPMVGDAGQPILEQDGSQANEPWPLPNPAGVVPIIPLPNRARLSGEGKSELFEVPSLQDAINKACSDMLLASEFGAFGQKYVTNFALEVDPNTGQPKQPFQIGVDRLLIAGPPEDGEPETRFGEFSPTPLAGYVQEVAMLIQHLASITRTPPHYFLANMGNFPSGEALRAAEAGLVTKAKRRQRVFGEAWEEAMRLAFDLLGDVRGQVVTSETIWRDPETQTESEHADAQMKQHALGVPLQQIWENLGYTPTQMARFKKMRDEEAAWGLDAKSSPNPSGPPTDPTGMAIAAGMPPISNPPGTPGLTEVSTS